VEKQDKRGPPREGGHFFDDEAAKEGKEWDDAQSFAWQCGWGEAQE
jgi:hypothetical protein